jgi:transcriptional regulator of acetoin/glycerol metabolism
VSKEPGLQSIVRALLDCREEEIAIFGTRGETLHLNLAAQATLPPTPSPEAARLRADLLARGGRAVLLQADTRLLGEMIIVRPPPGRTLAEQERQAIRETLEQTSGRLAVAARRLGISRTTLWRRLRHHPDRSLASRPSSALKSAV